MRSDKKYHGHDIVMQAPKYVGKILKRQGEKVLKKRLTYELKNLE